MNPPRDLPPETELATVEPRGSLASLPECMLEDIATSRSEGTKRAYRKDWERFSKWCEARGVPAMPAAPESVGEYIGGLSRGEQAVSVATIRRRLASIKAAHGLAGLSSPTDHPLVVNAREGIYRRLGIAPQHRRAAMTLEYLRAALGTCDEDLRGKRDRVILLLGFLGAFRRSEIVALKVSDVTQVPGGMRLHMDRSKTDQVGKGTDKYIATDPGRAKSLCPWVCLRDWLDAAGITTGPIFRGVDRHGHVAESALSDRAVADVVKERLRLAGIDPVVFSGHSMRIGLATQSARQGESIPAMMRQTGHKKVDTLMGYIRDADPFADNVTTRVRP